MSDREKARDQRIDGVWTTRYSVARRRGGRSVAWVAFGELGAVVKALPPTRRDETWHLLADHLLALAQLVADGELHRVGSSRAGQPNRRSTRPAALRARARRQA